jgi:hypothetical protein
MKRFFCGVAFAAAMFVMPAMANAQDKVEASLGADIVSNFIWRGMKFGEAAIQPSLSVGYKGFALEAWGSYGLTSMDDAKEVDLTLSYTTGGLTLGITDVFYVTGDDAPNYFMYETHKTNHTFEANIGYDFDIFSINAYTIFAGDDFNEKGKSNYSTYVEVAAPFKLGGMDWTATVGVVPMESAEFYETSGFTVTNLALQAEKELKVSETFSLPVFGGLTVNPYTENVYFTVGATF